MIQQATVTPTTNPWLFGVIVCTAVIHLVGMLLPINTATQLNPLEWYGAAWLPAIVNDHEWYRLLTAIFLHADFAHLAFNMVALLLFGSTIERVFGGRCFVAIYLGCGVAANGATMAYTYFLNPSSTMFLLGASGAIMAMLGCTLALVYAHRKNPNARLVLQRIGMIVALQVVFDMVFPHNSMVTHISGFLFGSLCGLVLPRLLHRHKTAHGTL